MRCRYCHNPDTWAVHTGKTYEADELLQKALRYRTYWKEAGGITVSGGEPMMQVDFVATLLKAAKAEGVNTAMDTSGIVFTRNEPAFSKIEEMLSYVDLVLLDLKHIDDEAHKDLTGHSNEAVLDFARESGCYNVTLNVWSCNEGAMRFYEKMGLVPQKIGMEKIL